MAGKRSSGKVKRRRHPAAYATAAGAAMAVAGPAQAAVHWSGPKDMVVDPESNLIPVDLNGDGDVDFQFSYWSFNPCAAQPMDSLEGVSVGKYSRWIGLYGYVTGNSAVGETFRYPYRLSQGDLISSGIGVWNPAGILALSRNSTWNGYGALGSGYFTAGNFVNQKGFIGVRFQVDGATHYAWIEFEGLWNPPVLSPGGGDQGSVGDGNTQSYPLEGRITGWAYEDVAERPIVAGDRGEPASVPTLNTWGMIFLAAFVLMEGTRRLRKGCGQS